jgi:hypothetical protein
MTRFRTILAAAVGLMSVAAVTAPASAQAVYYDRYGRPYYRSYSPPPPPPAYYYPPPAYYRPYYRPRAYYAPPPRPGFSFYFSN